MLDKHFFDGLSASFSCKCGHGSKVLDCEYLKFSDREALNRIDWIMSRVLVRLTFQSEYTESERFLSPLTVPSCSALPAGSPVDVGSFVRISSIIVCGGFCSLLIKSCPGEVSFCQASSLPLIIKEKADPEVCAGAICSSFFCFSFFERTKKRSRFLRLTKIFCYSVEFEK